MTLPVTDRIKEFFAAPVRPYLYIGDTSTLLATEVTAEQKEIMRKLVVPPLPTALP